MKTTLSLTVLADLTLLLICSGPGVADAQFLDGNREGLIVGGGVGYAAAVGESLGSVAGFTPFGRVGYGFSDEFALYFSSSLPSIAPAIGCLYYPDRHAPYYFQGALGYVSFDEDSLLSLSGGVGYELRDHVMIEFSLGFHRFTDTYTYTSYTDHIDLWIGRGTTVIETSHTNMITLAATFNVLLY